MKKTILALLVLLIAALIFTGCEKEAPLPKTTVTPETPTLKGTWIAKETGPLDETDPESPILEIVVAKLEITDSAFSMYSVTDDCSIGQFVLQSMIASMTPEDLALAKAQYPEMFTMELEWNEEPDMTGTYTISTTAVTFTVEGEPLPIVLSADKTTLTLSTVDETTGKNDDMVFVKQ